MIVCNMDGALWLLSKGRVSEEWKQHCMEIGLNICKTRKPDFGFTDGALLADIISGKPYGREGIVGLLLA
jgi:hypothetical protein